jgi:hypothetical protein
MTLGTLDLGVEFFLVGKTTSPIGVSEDVTIFGPAIKGKLQ